MVGYSCRHHSPGAIGEALMNTVVNIWNWMETQQNQPSGGSRGSICAVLLLKLTGQSCCEKQGMGGIKTNIRKRRKWLLDIWLNEIKSHQELTVLLSLTKKGKLIKSLKSTVNCNDSVSLTFFFPAENKKLTFLKKKDQFFWNLLNWLLFSGTTINSRLQGKNASCQPTITCNDPLVPPQQEHPQLTQPGEHHSK